MMEGDGGIMAYVPRTAFKFCRYPEPEEVDDDLPYQWECPECRRLSLPSDDRCCHCSCRSPSASKVMLTFAFKLVGGYSGASAE